VAEVRHAFAKHGGNLGTDGSVAFLFKHCGQFVFAPGTSEEKVMEAALDAGAEDVVRNDDGSVEVICEARRFHRREGTLLAKSGLRAGACRYHDEAHGRERPSKARKGCGCRSCSMRWRTSDDVQGRPTPRR